MRQRRRRRALGAAAALLPLLSDVVGFVNKGGRGGGGAGGPGSAFLENRGTGGHTKVDPRDAVGTLLLPRDADSDALPAHARGSAALLHRTAGNGTFVLTPPGAAGTLPTLWDVNGGRKCVGPYGREPPRFELEGSFSLEQCATIARLQPSAVGFRWGRQGVDEAAYTEYAVRARSSDAPIDLNRVFDGAGNATCAVYVRDGNVDWQVEVIGHEPEYTWAAGSALCGQRWHLAHLLYRRERELWFCYMEPGSWEQCVDDAETVRLQGAMSFAAGTVFAALLGYVARDLRQFEVALAWAVRPLFCSVLGIWAVARLLDAGLDPRGVALHVVAVVVVVVMQHLLLVPYRVSLRWSHLSAARVWLLLLLAVSPCLYADAMCYYAPFALLVAQSPVRLGLIAFALDAAAICLAGRWAALKPFVAPLDTVATMAGQKSARYAPMSETVAERTATA
eukprot:TRINITY_DN26296_c0_g1_i1.p1 TRINITY_DN26296_c0_g1~~TRINITY_DN26296_c0_g1_i1.p1  ORF type:complete len:450 (-),score=105.51 TRINITY_DN26296_c0_g1_i1:21-1370(-)